MFNRMFIGRNGPDQLSFSMILFSLVLSLVPWRPYMGILSLMITILAVLRMFSRNVEKRRKENLKFMEVINKIKSWYYRNKAKRQQSRLYKIFKCPQCSQKLRVPRGKGKVSIKCSKCGHKMIRNT